MIEQIQDQLWRIEVPLPGNPLKSINSYVIKSPSRNLIIDTGLDRQECLDAILAGLDEVGVDLEQTDFFITHMHADHSALVPKLAGDASKVYFNRPDAEVFEALTEPIAVILDAVRSALENAPPELSSDLVDRGIVMAGGGSLLRNLDVLISKDTGLPVKVSDNPLLSVVVGAGKAIDELDFFRDALLK